MDSPTPLVCQGRPVTDTGQPVGEPCGAVYRVASWPEPTPAEIAERARAAGWSVPDGAPPTCGRCRRPDPAIARGLTRPAPSPGADR